MITSHALYMSSSARSIKASAYIDLDADVGILKNNATKFARLSAREKAGLLRQCMPRLADCAKVWVREACKARDLDRNQSIEVWLDGPWITLRMMRLLADSLDAIAASGKPPLGTGSRVRADGRLEIDLFPASFIDKLIFPGFTGHVLMQQGVDLATARDMQASFFDNKAPKGGVALILGAGNVSSIPPTDAMGKMFIEGEVCLLKMNPVNEWVGPILEHVFAPIIEIGFLRVAYGGGDVGKYLCEHPGIDSVHITGSDLTHDLIVWGPPGADRDKRKKENDPLLKKPITSELGNVSPMAIVPAQYSDAQLNFQARNIVSMVCNNGSFNCNATKMLITAHNWAQKDYFLDRISKYLADAPTRNAYYPGAHDRYTSLVSNHANVQKFGQATDEKLAWAFIRDVDANNKDERLFDTEPFCGILSHTELDASTADDFIATATRFMNERLWGTLNAGFIIKPALEKDPAIARVLERAIVDLRYGTVAINHWPATSFAFCTMPWGGHSSATLDNVQSGIGWVHNTFMLEGIDKSVIRGPIIVRPKPAWFYDNHNGEKMGPRLISMENKPSVLKLPGLALSAL